MEGEKGRWGISLLALPQPVSLLCLSPINEGKMYTAHVVHGISSHSDFTFALLTSPLTPMKVGRTF